MRESADSEKAARGGGSLRLPRAGAGAILAAAILAAGGSAAWGQVCAFEDLGALRLEDPGGAAWGLERSGDLLFVTIASPPQFRIYDATDPEALRLLSRSPYAFSQDVAVSGSLAVLVGPGQVATVDTTDPEAPRVLATLAIPGDGRGVVIEGSVALIADGEQGVSAVDISNPAEPRLVGVIDTPGTAVRISAQDGVAYVADGTGGLRIIDVRSPEAMVEIASLTGWTVFGVSVEGNLLGTTALYDGVVIFVDVTNPAEPSVVGRMETRAPPLGIKLTGSTAWVSTGFFFYQGEFIGVDLRDPSAPFEFGSIGFPPSDRGASCLDFSVTDGYVHALVNVYRAYTSGWVALHTLDVRTCPLCYADCDGSGLLDFSDFLCFQNLFAAGSPQADCDGRGGLDLFDFLCFQNEFVAGCP